MKILFVISEKSSQLVSEGENLEILENRISATHNNKIQITLKRIVNVRCVFHFQGGYKHNEKESF